MNTINLLFALLFWQFSYSQNTQVLLIESCKVTRQKDTGKFFLCEKRGSCLDDPPPTSGQDCSHYEYNKISEQECRTACCPSLSKIEQLPTQDYQKCCPPIQRGEFWPAEDFKQCCPSSSKAEFLPVKYFKKCCPPSPKGKLLPAEDFKQCCPSLQKGKFWPAQNYQKCCLLPFNITIQPVKDFQKCCSPLQKRKKLPAQDLQKCCSSLSKVKFLPAQDLLQCCSSVSEVEFLPAKDLQQCINDWNKKEVLYVGTILAAILIPVAVLVIIALIFIKGFVKNPYTGKLVWVGCCCCVKKIDFSKDRGEIESDERLRRAMTEQKKINLQKVLQHEKSSQ